MKRPSLSLLAKATATAASVGVLAVTAAGAGFLHLEKRFSEGITVAEALPRETPLRQATPLEGYAAGSTEEIPVPVPASADAINILLMGSDSRQGDNAKGFGDPDIHQGQRSDTTILLHLAADRSFATAVSIPRDTWVTIPTCPRVGTNEKGGGFQFKFNAAFDLGGPACTVKLVEQLTGIGIDHFAVVDFAGFQRIVDELGGVTLCIPQDVTDPSSKLDLDVGVQTLNGEQSLSYVRARKGLGDGSDLSRITRQQQFLRAMASQASDAGILLDLPRLGRLLDATSASLTTDAALATPGVLRDLITSAQSLDAGNITFVTMPWLPRGDNENVIVDAEAAEPLWQSIADDRPWKKENRKDSGRGSSRQTPNRAC